ncbi:MAG TPA: cytochrome c [Steroidobacteraceae bacterium]|jgi:cytochrome c oxidase cbb3-type subunit 3
MYLRFHTSCGLLIALLGGCSPGPRPALPAEQSSQPTPVVSALSPGRDQSAIENDPRAQDYYNNAAAVNTGRILFGQFNCAGCHSNGGGGMGPSLMDDEWIYGGRLEQIHASIVEGRPNGMPAWGGKIPDQQIWQIAAYVRSMSLPQTIAAETGNTPSQSPAPVPPAADQHNGWTLPPETTNDFTTTTKGPN